jgi:hypothetical protein
MSQTLYDSTVAPKGLLLIKGGGHNNSGRVGGTLYQDAITAFVNRPPELGSQMPARR